MTLKKILPLIVLIAGLAAGYYMYNEYGEQHAAGTMASSSPSAGETLPEGAAGIEQQSTIDLEAALAERVLGNPDAPVRISEHSSFTCPHCATFHKTTYSALKSEYIDTGKAYLVFSDFPLNAPAMHASMIARCLPIDNYFNFVDMLYARQEEWAFEHNYMDFLTARAGEYGLDSEGVAACMNNRALQEGIVARMQAAQKAWQISSTPSFVINNQTVITGAKPLSDFTVAIEGGDADAPNTP